MEKEIINRTVSRLRRLKKEIVWSEKYVSDQEELAELRKNRNYQDFNNLLETAAIMLMADSKGYVFDSELAGWNGIKSEKPA